MTRSMLLLLALISAGCGVAAEGRPTFYRMGDYYQTTPRIYVTVLKSAVTGECFAVASGEPGSYGVTGGVSMVAVSREMCKDPSR
jgi:hypothetical protein